MCFITEIFASNRSMPKLLVIKYTKGREISYFAAFSSIHDDCYYFAADELDSPTKSEPLTS